MIKYNYTLSREHKKMTTVIEKLMDSKSITTTDVAMKSNVSDSTLRKAAKKPIESWSVRVLNAFATGLEENAGDLLNMLQPEQYTLEIDNEKQTIQGVLIPDKAVFQQIRGAVQATHLEGWNPTSDDIKAIRENVMHPAPADVERIKGIWRDSNE